MSLLVCPSGLEPEPKASEAFMVSNSTTGTFMKKNVPAKSFADKEKFSFAMPLHLRKFFRQIRSLKRASIFYPFLLPFCKRLWYNIFKKVKKFFYVPIFLPFCPTKRQKKGGNFLKRRYSYGKNSGGRHERRRGQFRRGVLIEKAGL